MGEKGKKRKRPLIPTGENVCSPSNKYKIVSLLGSGGFGDVYKVQQLGTGEFYALKTEDVDIDSRLNRLKVEATVLNACSTAQYRKHFLRLVDRGVTTKFKFIVMPIVGMSLDKIRREVLSHAQFSKQTAIKICVQTLNAVRDLHDIGFLHRDLKLANFAIGIDRPSHETIFMLDFGIAKRIAGDDGIIPEPREKVSFMGTRRYASRAAHQMKEQGRKDDVESWCYMVLDIFDEKCIPWREIKDNDELFRMKDELMHSRDDLFTECDLKPEINDVYLSIPREMCLIFDYINTLVFEDMVDFDYILDILGRIVEVNHWKASLSPNFYQNCSRHHANELTFVQSRSP
nr:Serine threonine protein kinase-related domain containing protein [Haemonchus contortus]